MPVMCHILVTGGGIANFPFEEVPRVGTLYICQQAALSPQRTIASIESYLR